jgi:hypothetical protein
VAAACTAAVGGQRFLDSNANTLVETLFEEALLPSRIRIVICTRGHKTFIKTGHVIRQGRRRVVRARRLW